MNSRSWKSAEYDTAKLFRGKRSPMRRFHAQGADVKLDVAHVEVKSRAMLPSWLTRPLLKCQLNSRKKIAMVLWKVLDSPIQEAVVVMSVTDAKNLIECYREMKYRDPDFVSGLTSPPVAQPSVPMQMASVPSESKLLPASKLLLFNSCISATESSQ